MIDGFVAGTLDNGSLCFGCGLISVGWKVSAIDGLRFIQKYAAVPSNPTAEMPMIKGHGTALAPLLLLPDSVPLAGFGKSVDGN